MKIVDYKKLVKLPADALFSSINKMNELGEVLVIGQYPSGRRFIYSPLADAGKAGNKEVDFDDNTFSRTGKEIEEYLGKLRGILDFVPILVMDTLKQSATSIPSADPSRSPIVPIVRPESARNFVDPLLVAPYPHTFEDGALELTAPFQINAHFSLLGISRTKSLLETGILDVTDAIDPSITLKAVYLHLETLGKPDEVVKIETLALPSAASHFVSQGGYREVAIDFAANLDLPANALTVTGAPSRIVSESVTVRALVSGSVNLELGDTRFIAQRIDSFKLHDELVRVKIIGYDLDAGRVNMNQRRRVA
jgi:hypothetical protein